LSSAGTVIEFFQSGANGVNTTSCSLSIAEAVSVFTAGFSGVSANSRGDNSLINAGSVDLGFGVHIGDSIGASETRLSVIANSVQGDSDVASIISERVNRV